MAVEFLPDLVDLRSRASTYMSRARGEGTKRAYLSALIQYEKWCDSARRRALDGDSETVGLYLTHLAERGLSTSSIDVHRAAIKAAYAAAGLTFPETKALLRLVSGIRRTYGVRPKRQARAATSDILRLLLDACPPAAEPMGARNRALLLIGFGGALRRSEIVGLTIGDVEIDPEGRGLLVLVRHSKTDQEGKGVQLAIHGGADPGFCPVAAFMAWMKWRKAVSAAPLFCQVSKSGRIFEEGPPLLDRTVARIVQACAQRAGLDSRQFSGHSLRRGLITAAAESGEDLADLMRQSRHKSVATVLRYVEKADLWKKNATRAVFR